jgi:chaperone modulatory protein CbpM
MISVQEFLLRARLEHRSLETFIAAGWIIPPQTEPELMFSDVDLARAQLIRDLREDFGVNDEGVSVVLHLIDQMHGLRRSMQDLLEELRSTDDRGRRTDRD